MSGDSARVSDDPIGAPGSSRVVGEAVGGPADRALTPVRVEDDRLILIDPAGTEFSVRVGSRLHRLLQQVPGAPRAEQETQAARPATTKTRPASAERTRTKVESALRPRDIQHRIRAGESAEQVAAVAGISVDKVMIFASPILAEREHVAQTALAASVRRRSSDPVSTVRALGEAARMRFRENDGDPEDIEWDAWRREDGRWTLCATYSHDGADRTATFGYDQPGRFVIPEDDEARWLVGDGRFTPGDHGAGRYDEHPLGDDAIELVSGPAAPLAPAVPLRRADPSPTDADADPGSAAGPATVSPDEPTVDLQATAEAVRTAGHAAHPAPAEPDDVTGDADWIAPAEPPDAAEHAAETEAEEPPHRRRRTNRPPRRREPEPVPVDDLDQILPWDEPIEQAAVSDAAVAPESEPRQEEPKPKRSKRSRGRASVPSWDEIMFGSSDQTPDPE